MAALVCAGNHLKLRQTRPPRNIDPQPFRVIRRAVGGNPELRINNCPPHSLARIRSDHDDAETFVTELQGKEQWLSARQCWIGLFLLQRGHGRAQFLFGGGIPIAAFQLEKD